MVKISKLANDLSWSSAGCPDPQRGFCLAFDVQHSVSVTGASKKYLPKEFC